MLTLRGNTSAVQCMDPEVVQLSHSQALLNLSRLLHGTGKGAPYNFPAIPRGHNFERYMKLEAHLDNIWNNGFNFKSLLECLLEL